ncbi:MAG TPA: small multi-drug export protein [Methanomicrobiales archaeon]|nr:small multi-drug export protein [Methanomicrobiales archaeon]
MAEAWGDDSAPIFSEKPVPDRGLRLALPFLLLALHLLVLLLAFGAGTMAFIATLMVIYELPPAGKETVIPAGILLGYPWWAVAASIALVDVEVGLFMVWNFDLAERIPVLGPWIRRFIGGGREFLAGRPWLTGLYFFGIMLMVMVPFFGSGGVRGSIVGRLLGMSRREVMGAIAAGALIGCFGIALGTLYLRQAFLESLFTGAAALLVLILAGIIVAWIAKRFVPGVQKP